MIRELDFDFKVIVTIEDVIERQFVAYFPWLLGCDVVGSFEFLERRNHLLRESGLDAD